MNQHILIFLSFGLIPCLFSGCKSTSESLLNSPEYQLANLVQIQSYALEKGDIDWFMSTYLEDSKTKLKIKQNQRTKTGWDSIYSYFNQLNMQHNGLTMTSENLQFQITDNSDALVMGQTTVRQKENKKIVWQSKFTLSNKMTRDGWKIVEARYIDAPH